MPLDLNAVTSYVEQNIGDFHQRRIAGLNGLQLRKVLGKKNPYLYKAKYMLFSQDIVRSITDAYISSQEETIFGNWLEGLALFINHEVYGGWKSGITGIDLEFDSDGYRNIVTIKSGPNWGNASQIMKMKSSFITAARTLRTSNARVNVRAVNGCCYGRDNNPDKGDYFKYCGQRFWEFISGEQELYTNLVEPLGHQARERNDDFMAAYAQVINQFTQQFTADFCNANGTINWARLVQHNSGIHGPATEPDPEPDEAEAAE
ncbi:MAG: cytosolic protein [Chitinophagaceae bacterium]|nr:MAG: cytosolic protein [Chitinophagaceae bacterium]